MMDKETAFELQQESAETLYRKGMAEELMNMLLNRIELVSDEDISAMISYMEMTLRERETQREEAVAAYSNDLPF